MIRERVRSLLADIENAITAKTAKGMRVNMCTEYEFVPLPALRKLQKALTAALDADEWVDQ
jgi:hypothetical protein